MMITTATEIKQVENCSEISNLIEVNLENILTEDFRQGLSSDINSAL